MCTADYKKQFGRQVMQFIGQIQKCNKISDENKQSRKNSVLLYLLYFDTVILWLLGSPTKVSCLQFLEKPFFLCPLHRK